MIQEEYPDEPISIVHERCSTSLHARNQHFHGDGCYASFVTSVLDWTGWKMDSLSELDRLKGRKLVVYLPEGRDQEALFAASVLVADEASPDRVFEGEPIDYFPLNETYSSDSFLKGNDRTVVIARMREMLDLQE